MSASAFAQARLLRYRFDSVAELRRHCRVSGGRVLLFFPTPQPPFIFGRILLELSFAQTGQQIVVPTNVHARAAGATSGLWLELRALSVVAGLQAALAGPLRAARRLGVDLVAYVRAPEGPVLACPVVDVSATGARVWGLPPSGPRVSVRIDGWPALEARVIWARGNETGLEFLPASRDAAQAMFAAVEGRWSSARVARHRAGCPCLEGGDPADPPPPRSGGSGLHAVP